MDVTIFIQLNIFIHFILSIYKVHVLEVIGIKIELFYVIDSFYYSHIL